SSGRSLLDRPAHGRGLASTGAGHRGGEVHHAARRGRGGAGGNGDRDVRGRADVDRGRRALRGVGEAGGGGWGGGGRFRSGGPPGTVDAAAARAFLDGPGHLRGLTSAGAGDRRTEAGDASGDDRRGGR